MAGRSSAAQEELAENLEAITAVQHRILSRLEGAREALNPPGLAQAREEVAGVVEELSHSAVLLGRVKKDLDSIFLRLRTLKRSLHAAFPPHAATAAAVRGGGAASEAAAAIEGSARERASAAVAGAEAAIHEAMVREAPAAAHGQQQQHQEQLQTKVTAGTAETVLDAGPPPH